MLDVRRGPKVIPVASTENSITVADTAFNPTEFARRTRRRNSYSFCYAMRRPLRAEEQTDRRRDRKWAVDVLPADKCRRCGRGRRSSRTHSFACDVGSLRSDRVIAAAMASGNRVSSVSTMNWFLVGIYSIV
jgi:hypothetical protein